MELLAHFGSPVVIVFYLLFRFERKIEDLTIAINTLQHSIVKKKLSKVLNMLLMFNFI
ncbi:YvrJ family protein [Cytobacillus pseudoceanisediminis]|uniref:YvrJ family protein n=1 Tax=Cytobacillus pseudoceanisediminis TaxID=3051614 RepID=UPI003C2EF0E3